MVYTTINRHVYISTALFSLLISLSLLLTRDVISRDSIIYIQTAQAFLDDGILAAVKIWGWPFYSIFIAWLHQITGLNFEQTAYLLTLFLEMLICVTFVKLYRQVAFNGARPWIAMLFILSFLALNDYRGDIIRGYGFWAFGLLSVSLFIQYVQQQHVGYAILWQLSITIATLFRIEGIVFAALAPFYVLFLSSVDWSQRFKQFLSLHSLFYSAIIISLLILAFSNHLRSILLNNLPAQSDYLSIDKVFGNFNEAAENFVAHVLTFDYSAEYAHLMLAGGLIALLLVKLISGFNIVYVGIWLTGYYQKWLVQKPVIHIIYFFIAIALLILVVFMTSRLFVSSRYLVFLLLLAGIIFCQYLDILFSRLAENKKAWLYILVTFMGVQLLDALISTGAKKTPIKTLSEQSHQLITQYTEQQIDTTKVVCNESRFFYYTDYACQIDSELTEQDNFLNNLKEYEFALLWLKDEEQIKLLGESFKVIKVVKNRKGDQAVLYKINP